MMSPDELTADPHAAVATPVRGGSVRGQSSRRRRRNVPNLSPADTPAAEAAPPQSPLGAAGTGAANESATTTAAAVATVGVASAAAATAAAVQPAVQFGVEYDQYVVATSYEGHAMPFVETRTKTSGKTFKSHAWLRLASGVVVKSVSVVLKSALTKSAGVATSDTVVFSVGPKSTDPATKVPPNSFLFFPEDASPTDLFVLRRVVDYLRITVDAALRLHPQILHADVTLMSGETWQFDSEPFCLRSTIVHESHLVPLRPEAYFSVMHLFSRFASVPDAVTRVLKSVSETRSLQTSYLNGSHARGRVLFDACTVYGLSNTLTSQGHDKMQKLLEEVFLGEGSLAAMRAEEDALPAATPPPAAHNAPLEVGAELDGSLPDATTMHVEDVAPAASRQTAPQPRARGRPRRSATAAAAAPAPSIIHEYSATASLEELHAASTATASAAGTAPYNPHSALASPSTHSAAAYYESDSSGSSTASSRGTAVTIRNDSSSFVNAILAPHAQEHTGYFSMDEELDPFVA